MFPCLIRIQRLLPHANIYVAARIQPRLVGIDVQYWPVHTGQDLSSQLILMGRVSSPMAGEEGDWHVVENCE